MRVQVIDAAVPERLSPRDSAGRWTKLLHEGGYFVEVAAGAGAAAGALSGLRRLLGEVDAAEKGQDLARHPIAWLTGGVPNVVWAAMIGVFAVLGILGGPLVAIAGAPLVYGVGGFVGLGFAVGQERARREFGRKADAAREQFIGELVGVVAHLAGSTFVIPASGALVVGAPHRLWVSHRLRDLRVARGPEAPAAWDALADDLNAEAERVDRALREAAQSGRLAAAELTVDLPDLAARFDALGVRTATEGAWLDARLRGAA